MLVTNFKDSLGKSSQGGETLYDHTIDCVRIAHKILTDPRFMPLNYSKQKRDQLLFASFIHDIGKLDRDFQAMLQAARDGKPLPSKRVKHEASTLNFGTTLMEDAEEVKNHLQDILNYRFTEPINFEDALAFAVTHHGLFYLSFEVRDGQMIPRIRREWTVFNYGEIRRITLIDLLFDYYPLGGVVIIADLLGSFCYEQSTANVDDLISYAKSFRDLIDLLIQENAAEKVEESVKQYDLRTYRMRDLLNLLAGGLE